MDEINETMAAENTNTSSNEVKPIKRTILPPAGPEEMAKSARTTLEELSISWTKGRHEVHHRGTGQDKSRPRKYSKSPRK